MFCRASLVLSFISVLVSAAPSSDDKCQPCDAYGQLREPNTAFTHTENCREMLCKCNCNGDWECPPERAELVCQPSNPECGTCWAGGAMREGNRDFKFTEGCFQYNCFCNCDGAWNCPSDQTINVCNYNVTSGCYYCDVYGQKYQGGSYFKHVNGCIEYDCKCDCDGGWNCPGEKAVDRCNTNQETGCYYCDVHGKKYEGNTRFKHVNGCIEYNCACNCDGSWNCPGENAIDTCRTNQTTGCYYCNVNGYMYEGNSRFPHIDSCFLYQCDCACDGGWTCENSIGEYVCDAFGNEPVSECRSCKVDENEFRGESRFFYKKGCITYKCSCDCAGRYYCSGNDAFYTCAGYEGQAIISLSSSYSYVYRQHTRSPRQVTGCLQCAVDGKTYDTYQTFNRQVGCNLFTCTCQCDGTPNCLEQYINICAGPTGGGSGASTFGSEVSPDYVDYGTGVNVCADCKYRGKTYEGNSPFSFESGCWKYNCNCYCNGSISCPSDRSKYICPGRTECIKCKVDDRLIDPNTEFQLRRGCVSYKQCSCSCDGGWDCADGEYTCDLCQSCTVDGQSFAGNSTFSLVRGCDRYKSCYCGCDAKWQCSGEVEDLCGACRKCKIGDDYYEGDTTFQAQVQCTKYRRCECNCDGSYRCVRGSFTCGERGDMPIEEQCPDCVHGGRRYRPGQTFNYEDSCIKYKSCTCHCGKTSCREVEDKCGNCRSCLVESMEHRGGTKFAMKNGCLHYKECDCFCSGNWKCYGKSAIDTCNTCKKCNVDDVIHEPYSRFKLNRDCWKYHCFCGCNGSTKCPSQTAVNTCTQPDVCYSCEVGNKEYSGNSLFSYTLGDMEMSCKCSCDGSYYCIAERLFIKTNLTISGDDLGGCFYCYVDGQRIRGDTKFSSIQNDVEMNCQCFCNGGYYCYGEKKYESTACRGCRLYGTQHPGDSEFSIVYNGFKLACQCSCDGTYLCYGTEGTAVISCISGVGCLTQTCGQCIVQGERFNGGDVFASTYKGREVRCDCGCDGSYYCEGSGGIILSCVNGVCREYGCSSCQVFDQTHEGETNFEVIYKGLKLDCECECGGNYQCMGASGVVVVACIDNGAGCLSGACGECQIENRRYAGRSTFRYVYNGIDMMCTCSCDTSFYCVGVYEEIEISCIGGTCSRIGCKSCNVYGSTHPGDSSFDMIYGGLKLDCRCECTSDYLCKGSDGTTIVSCLNGRNCLPATCGSCYVNNREYAGRSTYRSVYKGIDVLCTCGCDSSSYCRGTTTSIEVTCIGGTCNRIGCRECSIFGTERPGSSQFDIIYEGIKLACECDCDGGYICRGGTGIAVITCVNGVGPGCLTSRCGQCLVDNRSYQGFSTFDYVFQGIDMKCTCSCDGSYYCTGVSELIEVSCFGGTCTPIGCKKCRIYGGEIDGASPFQIVYGGVLLDCMCSCDGSYKCLGERNTIVVQCRYNGNCISSRCQQCVVNDREHDGGTSFRDVYNGIDVTCTCGCDSSYICVGISTEFKVSCIGENCNVIGCQQCVAYGRPYTAFEKFEVIYRGMRLVCECDCNGGYICKGTSGEIFVRCRDGRNCLPSQCGTCRFDGRFFHGQSFLKYNYQGIDMSCTCGCDGSVFCEGVTDQLELWCVDGKCTPSGCRSCSVYGNEIDPLTTFNIVHQGMYLDCTCACDSGFVCLSKKKEKIITCAAGQGNICLSSLCQDCMVDGVRREARSNFPYVYEGIDLKCTCGCDGTSYCEGVRYDIIVSCIGGTCSPQDCKSCTLFGQSHPAYKPFQIVLEGARLDCTCACDSSFICRGKGGRDVITCRPGEQCLATTCQDCMVGGLRRRSRSTFPFVYEDIDMTCQCGCDGSAYCEGIREEIVISCIGGSCSPQGCRTCTLFGQSYPPYRPFQIVHEGARLDCTCACDSSFICRGKGGRDVITCQPGEQCLATTCQDCMVGGLRRRSRSTFPFVYEDIDMTCQCGCDGSAYCEGIREEIVISCIGGSCSPQGCRDCSLFGRNYPPFRPFQIIYEGVRLDCTCACDSSFICYGESKKEVISCRPGQTCPYNQRCTDCLVGGRRRKSYSVFAYKYEGIDMKCSCGCDGSAYCEGVREEIILSCIGSSCAVTGCQTCSVFGINREAYKPFNIVYEGLRIDCTCNCDGSFVCVGKSGEKVIGCRPGENCLSSRCNQDCVVDGRRYRPRSTFPYKYNDIDMTCTCGCDTTSYCEGVTQVYFVSCIGERCFRAGCQKCNLFGEEHSADSPFSIVYEGVQMNCDCNCDSSWRCEGRTGVKDIDCAVGQRCLPKRCRKCRVGNRRYDGGETFQFDYKNTRMSCVCGCDGTYYCKGVSTDYEIACPRRGPCTQIGGCRKCNIFGSEYYGGSRNEFVYQGYFMTCTCDCDSSYKCVGSRGELVVECGIDKMCLINKCGPCRVDGKTIRGGSVFDYDYNGRDMQCTCGCDGSYFCKCKDDDSEISCNNRGSCTQLGCSSCMSDGRQRQTDEEFEKYHDGVRMSCVCECDGSYRCKGISDSITVICRGDSCDPFGCLSCLVDGRKYTLGEEYERMKNGRRVRCRCKCSGTSLCEDIGRPECIDCVIDGQTYPGHSRNRVYRNGQSYICDCLCSGKSECNPEGPACRECDIFGQKYPGNRDFETVVQGTTMNCKCDCSGSFECRGGGRVCTSSTGCQDTCPGCLIEGKTYSGGSNFDIFHNGYGINMNCNCECGGSYKCQGKKPVTPTCITGDCSNTCLDCTIDGKTYRGNSVFDTILDNIPMRCTCHCTGGYSCEGHVTQRDTCQGVGCLTDGCTNCQHDGKSYPANTEFELQNDGITMQCSCACNGTLLCKGQRKKIICIGSGCDKECGSCNYEGNSIPGESRFQTRRNGRLQICTCGCNGQLTCEERSTCTGPGCQTTGCRRCVIDGYPYTGNTRFALTKGSLNMNCSCFCDGTYSCSDDITGFEYSCLGNDCPSDQCRPCDLDGRNYQLDDKFRLSKNALEMNCVCECDGAYRCFSISGYCTGSDCDDYGCSSCIIGSKSYKGNSRFELKPGTTCECDCNGEYRCSTGAIGFECVGANCGIGSCKSCRVDNEIKTGDAKFQFTKYGLFMQCACNCDSTYTCRGYQIISDGSGPVDIPCVQCVINGKKYNPMTRFQTIIDGERKVCSCDCRGQHSCSGRQTQCRNCVIGVNEYQGNADFALYKQGQSIRCRCNCNGDFVCEGQGTCRGGECSGCRDCIIFGTRHKGGSRFYTGSDPQLLCDCSCSGEYVCKGYRTVTKVILAPEVDVAASCASCYVAENEHPGNTNFKIRRGCYLADCYCSCSGEWECPEQEPEYVCDEEAKTERVYYSLAGTIGSENEPIQFTNTRATVIYRDETSSTIFGQGGGEDCKTCVINKQKFDGNTAFILQDGCLRWSCLCNCNGGWTCSSVVGTDCSGPLDPFEGKTCTPCKAYGQTYAPEQQFTASDECYRYTCTCNCDGSYECPPELTIKTCSDSSQIYSERSGTCRQCEIGNLKYNFGDKFEYVFDCIRYVCDCKCDGSYFCPSSTGIRVCRTGSGTPGRFPITGSRTATKTKTTYVALRPSGAGSVSGSQSTVIQSGGGESSVGSGGFVSSGGFAYGTGQTGSSSRGGGQIGSGSFSRTQTSYQTSRGTATSGGTATDGSSYQTGYRQSGSGTVSGGSRQSGSGTVSGGSVITSYQTGGSSAGYSSGSSGLESGLGDAGSASSSSGSSGYSYSSSSSSSSGSSGSTYRGGASYVPESGSVSSQSGSSCRNCIVNGDEIPGGRDFSYRDRCIEYNCECKCDGSHSCPEGKSFNFCDRQKATSSGGAPVKTESNEGCTIGGKTYTTQFFTHTDFEKCIKYVCRCFKNGSYNCDPDKTKRVC